MGGTVSDETSTGTDVSVKRKVSEELSSHSIFSDLEMAAEFYERLSDLVFPFMSRTRMPVGLDSAFFDSLAGTVESIKALLLKGMIGDAYTLLRRFREVGWLQIYVMVRLEDQSLLGVGPSGDGSQVDSERLIELVEQAMQKGIYVDEIERWMAGEESLPELRVFNQRIASSPAVGQLNLLFAHGYKEIHDRCNDHVHINTFPILRANVPGVDFRSKTALLEQFADDFRDLFIRHVAYVFSVKQEYMASTDYVGSLECGLTPDDESQYWVAPFVQEVFDRIVALRRPDVMDFFRDNSSMELV